MPKSSILHINLRFAEHFNAAHIIITQYFPLLSSSLQFVRDKFQSTDSAVQTSNMTTFMDEFGNRVEEMVVVINTRAVNNRSRADINCAILGEEG